MNKMTAFLFLSFAVVSCKKDDPSPTPTPAPPPVPEVVCCPTEAPQQIQPNEGDGLSTPILWQWNKVEGAHHYALEALCDWTVDGQNYEAVLVNRSVSDTFLLQTTLPTIPVAWSGAQGRWRVVAIGEGPVVGPWSGYRDFTVQ